MQARRMIKCAESCGNRIERILADLLGKNPTTFPNVSIPGSRKSARSILC